MQQGTQQGTQQGMYPGMQQNIQGNMNQGQLGQRYMGDLGQLQMQNPQSSFGLNDGLNSDFQSEMASKQANTAEIQPFTSVASSLSQISKLNAQIQLNDRDMRYYYNCYNMAKEAGRNALGVKEASEFIMKSGIDYMTLQKAWSLSIPYGINIPFPEFKVLLRLIALRQQGNILST